LAAKVVTSIYKFDHYLPKSPLTSAVSNFTYPNEIASFIQKLKSSNALGTDEITIKVVKTVANIIANPLSHLINNYLETGIFPSALKLSKVIPIFKTGDQNILSNYRPILLLQVFSKVFDKDIFQRLKTFFTKIRYSIQKTIWFSTKIIDVYGNSKFR